MFISLLGVLHTLGIADNVVTDLEEALALLESEGPRLAIEVPEAQNRAKQLAIELADRVPVIVGAGPLAPVARRWKTQFNENSKSWAYFEALPEMNHNALSGIRCPAGASDTFRVLFLKSRGAHPRIQLRAELTPQIMGEGGVISHQVLVTGESPLAQILSAIQFGDYVSCYLAALYGVDPTDIGDIVKLKGQMSSRPPAGT
jgi:glucose/mannose-6-phosphate isomerase